MIARPKKQAKGFIHGADRFTSVLRTGSRFQFCMPLVPPHPDIAGQVYGLVVASDIALPELAAAAPDAAADITIRQGPVPRATGGDPGDFRNFVRGSKGELWLDIPEKLSMLITGGTTLTYCPHQGIHDDELRLFLLGSGLAAIMMQRGSLVLHANAIVPRPGETAIACIGASGAGKSTMAVAMMQRGHRCLADDVCPVGERGLMRPGLARAKLWDDAARRLGIDTATLSRVRPQDAKWNLPLCGQESVAAAGIGLLVCLEPSSAQEGELAEITGVERFTVLRNNVFRPEYYAAMGLEPALFRRIAELASATPLFRLSRPTGQFDIDTQVDKVLALHARLTNQEQVSG